MPLTNLSNGKWPSTKDTRHCKEQGGGRQVPRSGAKRRKQSYAKNKIQSAQQMIIIEQQIMIMMIMMMTESRKSNGR